MRKFRIGQTAFYMYINMICKCKITGVYEKNGETYYTDSVNNNIMERYLFRTKDELFAFHSGRKRNGRVR